MYPELYQYLLLHNNLPIPGIGTFSVERTPARMDFPNRLIHAPAYQVSLREQTASPSGYFYYWLGKALQVSDLDAVIRFNDFVFELKRQISAGNTINWQGVGTVKKGLSGGIQFEPAIQGIYEDPVPAEKVLREKAEHIVRVGEEERTATEMENILARPADKKSGWWAYAGILALLSVIFIGWYLSENGLETDSVANTQKLVPAEAVSTYRVQP